MGRGLTFPTARIEGVHWLRETGIACDVDKGETTFALGAVSCPDCREVLDAELDFVSWQAAGAPVDGPFDLSDV